MRFKRGILSAALALSVALFFMSLDAGAYTAGDPEFRTMWVSRFEWPNANKTTCQNKIIQIMDNLQQHGFNAVLFQVRGQGETLYPSPYEPWSGLLGGVGQDPGWDPLQYALDAAHARGIEFHAYINACVIWQSGTLAPPPHTTPEHPYWNHCDIAGGKTDWLLCDSAGTPVQYNSDDYVWAASGVPSFQEWFRRQVLYVVSNYNVDGVHFDRIRFPANTYSYDPISNARRTGNANPHSLAFKDWQRDQITRMLTNVYGEIQNVRPSVKVSCAPFGIYDRSRFAGYSGFTDAYDKWLQDAQHWSEVGCMDAIVPMIYWDIPDPAPNYDILLDDWVTYNFGRHIYGGGSASKYTFPELGNEIQYGRNNGADGFSPFSYGSINATEFDTFLNSYYTPSVTTPGMPWKTSPTFGVIRGVIRDGAAQPVTDAWVTRSGATYVSLSSYDGVYDMLTVSPGTYTISATKTGVGSASASGVVVTAGSVVTVDLTLTDGTATNTPTFTATNTPTNTLTQTPTQTITNTATSTPTGPTATPTSTPTQTPTFTVTFTATQTPTYTPTLSSTPSDLIVDNVDAGYSEVTVNTAWGTGTSAGRYGTNYKFNDVGSGNDTATWQVTIPVTGNYDVSEWHSTGTNRADNAPFTIYYSGGSQLVLMNQKLNGGVWNLMGTFYFTAGNYTVRLTDSANPNVVMADAIKWSWHPNPTSTPTRTPTAYFTSTPTYTASNTPSFTPTSTISNTPTNTPTGLPTNTPPNTPTVTPTFTITYTATQTPTQTPTAAGTPADLIVDNSDPDYSDAGPSSGWITATIATNKWGTNYRYNTVGTGTDSATWQVNISTPGYYDVSIWYSEGLNRPVDSPFSVYYSGGSQLFQVNQQLARPGETWLLLETFYFDAGTYSVVLTDQATPSGKVVLADAVRWSWAGALDTPTSTPTGPTATPTQTPTTTPTSVASQEYRVIWADSWNASFLNASEANTLVQTCRDNNINTIMIEVRKIGDAYYDSAIEPRATNITGGSTFDPLGYLLSVAHDTSGGKKYIQVHGWFVAHRISKGEVLDASHVLSLHPEYVMLDSTGSDNSAGSKFLDPGHPAVVEHNLAVILDCLSNYDIDGINLDYIRYPGGTWGYNAQSISRFNTFKNLTGSPATNNPDWQAWRRECVTQEVKKIYVKSWKLKPNAILTTDTINWGSGYSNYATSDPYISVFQDWVGWLQLGIIDYNALMDYATDDVRFNGWCNLSLSNDAKRGSIIGCGNYLQTSVQNGLDQLLYARAQAADGLNIYDWGSEVDASTGQTRTYFYQQLKAQVFPSWADPPTPSWKASPTKGIVEGNLTDSSVAEDHATVTVDGQPSTQVYTDGAGWYAILDVTPGSYNLRFSKTGHSDKLAPFTISTAGEIVTVNADFALDVKDWDKY